MAPPASEVLITGAAAVGPHGCDLDAFADALRIGRALSRPLGEPPDFAPRRRCQSAATVASFDDAEWIPPRAARRMSRLSRFAVATGRMALASAEWTGEETDLAVCLSTVFGPCDYVNTLLQQIVREGPRTASPALFTDCVANAAAGQLAIATKARAANFTVCQREAGAVLALAQGFREIHTGRAKAALVGAVDEVEHNQVAILDWMRVLAPNGADVRPFAHDRCGMMLGEGAGMLLLQSAVDRPRRPLARVVSAIRAFDPTATRAGYGRGHESLADVLRQRLEADGVELSTIDAVVCSANGSRAGDRLEGRMLHDVFGDDLPPVLVPKSVVGEYGVGGGLVPAVLALRGGEFQTKAGHTLDPELGIVPFAGTLAPPRRVLLSGLGTGGAAGFVVLESIA